MSFSKDDSLKALSAFYRLGSRNLTLLGGEPTLCGFLDVAVEYAKYLGFESVSIDTNAMNIESILRIDPSILKQIRVSLDGAKPSTHDKVRGSGSYDTTIQNIGKLVKSGYRIAITSTFFSFNLDEAPEVLKLSEDLGIELVNLHVFSEEGNGARKHDWAVNPYDWIVFCEYLETFAKTTPLSIWYPPSWCSRDNIGKYVEHGFQGCLGRSIDRFSIFPDGRCYICSLLFDYDMHFAQYNNGEISINRQENEFELFLKAHASVSSAELSGCPAEDLYNVRAKRLLPEELVSLCRCWKVQA
jgi:MoaA/NifB/PqqE/SkfB family radical SAM enzyme